MAVKPSADSIAETFPGADITAEEWVFIQAITAYQRRHRKKFLAWSEVLQVVHSLGYRRISLTEPNESCPSSATPTPPSASL
jgi:hypothetical protein